MQPMCVQMSQGPHVVFPVKIETQRNVTRKCYILAIATAMSNKQSFVISPAGLCFLAASIKLWQSNLLAYKWDKNLRSFNILEMY